MSSPGEYLLDKQKLDGQAYDESGGVVAAAPGPLAEITRATKPERTSLVGILEKSSGVGFITRDSGQRAEFDTGARRDTAAGKGRFDLIPPVPIKRLAQLFERGAIKYGERNWEKGIPLYRYLDSAARHLNDYMAGDRVEDHLTAVVWNCICFIATEAMIEAGKLPEKLREGSK